VTLAWVAAPATLRKATITKVPTNRVAMVSHPEEVVTIIETAAAALPVAT
jgi:hypothetical protein